MDEGEGGGSRDDVRDDVDEGEGEGSQDDVGDDRPHEVLARRIVFDLLLLRVTVELQVSSRLLWRCERSVC